MMRNKRKRDEAYNIRKIYEQMELDLIASMKRNLTRHEKEEIKQGFRFEQWQSAKLRDLERFRRENRKIIDRYGTEVKKSVRKTLLDTYRNAQENVNSFMLRIKVYVNKLIKNTIGDVSIKFPSSLEPILKPIQAKSVQGISQEMLENIETWNEAPTPKEESFFRMNDDKFNTLMETVDNDFNKANTAVLRRMDDIYRQTIFKAQVPYNMSSATLDQAIDMAAKDFLTKGIDAITYKNGNKVNIASYAEMALRTANHRAYLMAEGKKRQEMGLSLVVVSAHATACKLCVPWQGKILIDDVYSGGKKEDGPYPLLSEAMEKGFLHPNCRHNLNTYFPGITTLPDVPDLEKALENYEQEQKQRHIERQIRRQKRVIVGTVDEANLNIEKDKLKKLQADMRNHLKDNSQLRRSYRKEKLHDVSSNDLKAHEDTLKRKAMDVKIEDARDKILKGEYNTKVRGQKQQEHVLGTKQWTNRAKRSILDDRLPQGAFYKEVDIQGIVDGYKGKGVIEFRGRDLYPREYVSVGSAIGRAYDTKLKKYVESNRVAIHYAKKGTHLYPVVELKED